MDDALELVLELVAQECEFYTDGEGTFDTLCLSPYEHALAYLKELGYVEDVPGREGRLYRKTKKWGDF